MKEKVFNKLVRDNIPDKIKNNGEEAVTRILNDDEEYKLELYKKLLEEAGEVIESKTSDETAEELADVLEVLKAIAQLNDKKLEDIVQISEGKRQKRGGFEKRVFLEKIYSDK